MLVELPVAPISASRFPGALVAAQTARRAVRSGVLWGYVFGLYVASSTLGYADSYKTAAQRDRLAATFGSGGGFAALIGPARDIQTVAGYTAWKSLGVLAVVGAAWGLLAGTRLLRGEEDAGRWELLLAGQTTRRRAAAQALVGLGAGLATLWGITAVITVVVGRSSKVQISASAGLFYALALVSGAAVFLAVGALTSQLAATRRQAASYGGAALGAAFVVRMVADSWNGLAWLRWASPLGWVEELRPLTGSRPLALVPLIASVVVLAGLTVHLADTRDLGGSTLADRDRPRPHLRLLSGPSGLTVRLVRSGALGWTVAVAVLGLVVGLGAKQAASAVTASPSVERLLSRLGAHGSGASQYVGFSFLIAAVLLAAVAAGQVSAARGEEAEGRLEHLLVRPVSRSRWWAARLAVTGAVVVGAGLAAGISAWVGAASQHAGMTFSSLVGAGLNLAPPALGLLGVAAFVMGVWPRAATMAGYGLLAWSLLVELVGGVVASNHWLLDTSLFHQMVPAPAQSPDWVSAGALVALGLAGAVAGGLAFSRRDLVGE